MLSIRLKLMQIPPRVEVNAPPKLVPPENAVTGIRRRKQIFMISLTSDVVLGCTTRAGFCDEGAGDHGVLECLRRNPGSVATFLFPRSLINSSCASAMLPVEISCLGAGVSMRGVVERVFGVEAVASLPWTMS